MKKHLSLGRLPLAVLFALLFTAIHPRLVFAEGETPEIPSVETSSPNTTEPEDEIINTAERLADANAVIVDQYGVDLPLASQTALNALCDPDPWFYGSLCSGGICRGLDPLPPNNDGFPTLQLALANWVVKKGYGMIYLEGNYSIDEDISINGSIAGMSTLKGIVRDPFSIGLKPTIQGTLNIYNFPGGFTLSGIQITKGDIFGIHMYDNIGTIKISDVTATKNNGTGIFISNKGPVILDGVSVTDNTQNGASISNQYWNGTAFVSSGNVTVSNSEFRRNGSPGVMNYSGLLINSKGVVLLNGVTSFGNNGDGLDLGVYGSAIIKNSVFSENIDNPDAISWGFGIQSYSDSTGTITLDNVVLAKNGNSGALLATSNNVIMKKISADNNQKNGIILTSNYNTIGVGAKNVTITDAKFFENNQTNLEIHASGIVSITNLISNGSVTGMGLFVNNTYAATPQSITLNNATLNQNQAWRGGTLQSKGNITINGIVAEGNGTYGVYLDNYETGATGSVTVLSTLGINRFIGNGGYGIWAQSYKTVSMSNVQSNNNGSWSVVIDGVGPASNVILTGVEALNNTGRGIYIGNAGTVTISKTTASGNAGTGLYIDNDAAVTSKNVLISSSTFSNNTNGGYGIEVYSVGAISLTSVTANNNAATGIMLQNHIFTLATQIPQAVTVSKSIFNNNVVYGIMINSQRKISLSNLTAIENTNLGVYVDNLTSTFASAVSISGVNNVSNNGAGIFIYSHGIVTASGINSFMNGTTGIRIQTDSIVSISTSQLNRNGY